MAQTARHAYVEDSVEVGAFPPELQARAKVPEMKLTVILRTMRKALILPMSVRVSSCHTPELSTV